MQCISIAPHECLIISARLTAKCIFSFPENFKWRDIFVTPAVREWGTGNARVHIRRRGAGHSLYIAW